MDYKEFFENNLRQENDFLELEQPKSRLEYLADHVFDFTTYDGGMDQLFAQKAVEVIDSINNRTTFEYQEKNQENYQWYLIMVNMPFFQNRLNWGTSIRGAWWDVKITEINSCGFYIGEQQITESLSFNNERWIEFMKAIVEFAKPEMTQ